MQIQNNFNTHSGAEYRHSHTHHITKCMFDDEEKKLAGAAGNIKNGALSANAAEEKNSVEGIYGYGDGKRSAAAQKKPGFFREFWDSMGDSEKSAQSSGKKAELQSAYVSRDPSGNVNGLSAASSAIKQAFSRYIVQKWENVREKIQAGVHSSLKRFGKREDAFAALSNPGHRFSGKKRERHLAEKPAKGTRGERPEIQTAALSDNHLLDYYSKTGEYCHIKDHL